jgi:hypothetical protein
MMSKNWTMLASMLVLGNAGVSLAHPLDTPDIVYIDGLPCNATCQSYMAWSRQRTSPVAMRSGQPARRSPGTTAQRAAGPQREGSRPAAARIAALQPAGSGAAASEPARAGIAASPAANGVTATPSARSVQHRVAAAVELAEQVTAATASPASGKDRLVALVMARPEIKSVPDLAARTVAIEERQSASSTVVRTAIAAAGATGVDLSAGSSRAVNRVINGEVPAAVLALACPEAAELFPDIAGFRIFRVPLSPRPSNARLEAQ